MAILKAEVNVGMCNIDLRNSVPELDDIADKVLIRHIELRCQFFLFFLDHFERMKDIPLFNMADKYYISNINLLKAANWAFQHCESLLKC